MTDFDGGTWGNGINYPKGQKWGSMWKPGKDGEGQMFISRWEGLVGSWRKKGTWAFSGYLGAEVGMKSRGGEGLGALLAQSVKHAVLDLGVFRSSPCWVYRFKSKVFKERERQIQALTGQRATAEE